MATVTGFESLPYPTKSELRQFAELFSPLFQASSEEAKRQAVAALSQSPHVPAAVAVFIASQPISIAAPFLVSSPCLSDDVLIMIARTQGLSHARAIVRRESLSPTVIDALVDLRHEKRVQGVPSADAEGGGQGAALSQPDAATDEKIPEGQGSQTREEELRRTIKALAQQANRPASDRLGLRSLTPVQEALLVRFARNREAGLFATTLSDVLSSSRWLAERIMLDISGRQLAATLSGVAMDGAEAAYVLSRFYPHLASTQNGQTKAQTLLLSLDPVECEDRIEAWLRADHYTFPKEGQGREDDALPRAANVRPAKPAPPANRAWSREKGVLKGRR